MREDDLLQPRVTKPQPLYVTMETIQDSQLNQRDLAGDFDQAFLFNCLNMFQ